MTDLNIRGRGDTRDVYDGDVLVGRIHRRSREGWSGTINVGVSASFRKVTHVWWIASWPDGAPVRLIDGRRLVRDHIKDFRRRDAWTGRLVAPPTPQTA